jgi:hypothetical protein
MSCKATYLVVAVTSSFDSSAYSGLNISKSRTQNAHVGRCWMEEDSTQLYETSRIKLRLVEMIEMIEMTYNKIRKLGH